MTKIPISEVLTDRRSRLVTGHPDDSIWYAALGAGYRDEALLSRGEAGRNGLSIDRVTEERAALAALRLSRLLPYFGTDGSLNKQVAMLAPRVARDAIRDRIGILVGNSLVDHPDHFAAGQVALLAGKLACMAGYDIGVILLRPDNDGDYVARATQRSARQAFLAARHHNSQWDMQDRQRAGWQLTPGNYFMAPHNYAALGIYPLTRDASFDYVTADELTAPTERNLVGNTIY